MPRPETLPRIDSPDGRTAPPASNPGPLDQQVPMACFMLCGLRREYSVRGDVLVHVPQYTTWATCRHGHAAALPRPHRCYVRCAGSRLRPVINHDVRWCREGLSRNPPRAVWSNNSRAVHLVGPALDSPESVMSLGEMSRKTIQVFAR